MNREENIQAYLDAHLKPGRRVWLFEPSGMTMQAKRLAVFRALALKVYEHYGPKWPWELFRFGIEREENEEDEFATSLFLWKFPDWEKLQIGYVPRTKKKQEVNHNRAVVSWLDDGKLETVEFSKSKDSDETFESIRVDLVHMYWDEKKKWGGAIFALHTDYEVSRLPRGVEEIENYSLPPESEEEEEVSLPVVKAPEVKGAAFPPAKIIDKLISAHNELIGYFRLEEPGGICEPVFMNQWREPPQQFEDQAALEKYAEENDTYTTAAVLVDLNEVASSCGPVMARNYYRLSGVYEGPFTDKHCHQVLINIMEALAVIRRFQRVE